MISEIRAGTGRVGHRCAGLQTVSGDGDGGDRQHVGERHQRHRARHGHLVGHGGGIVPSHVIPERHQNSAEQVDVVERSGPAAGAPSVGESVNRQHGEGSQQHQPHGHATIAE